MKLEQLSTPQFDRFREFIYAKSGIRIQDNKVTLLSNRIRRRVAAGEWADYDAYYEFLISDEGRAELEFFLDAITTNETFFFRTRPHFDWLTSELIPEVIAKERRGEHDRSLRFWSAGCASGAEPYSIAICMQENMFQLRDWDITIVGSDISEEALRAAREGIFRPRTVKDLDEKQLRRFFKQTEDESWQVRSMLRDSVTFERHNLMGPPLQPPFDVIFIRNVLIYFDRASKQTVVDHLVKALAPGGYLVVGPSEGLFSMLDPLTRHSTFLYEKPR